MLREPARERGDNDKPPVTTPVCLDGRRSSKLHAIQLHRVVHTTPQDSVPRNVLSPYMDLTHSSILPRPSPTIGGYLLIPLAAKQSTTDGSAHQHMTVPSSMRAQVKSQPAAIAETVPVRSTAARALPISPASSPALSVVPCQKGREQQRGGGVRRRTTGTQSAGTKIILFVHTYSGVWSTLRRKRPCSVACTSKRS